MIKVVVKETRRSRSWKNMRGGDLPCEGQSARLLVEPLFPSKGLLHLRWKSINHRVPDGPGELQEMRIKGAKGLDGRHIGRMRIVLIENARIPVVHDQA